MLCTSRAEGVGCAKSTNRIFIAKNCQKMTDKSRCKRSRRWPLGGCLGGSLPGPRRLLGSRGTDPILPAQGPEVLASLRSKRKFQSLFHRFDFLPQHRPPTLPERPMCYLCPEPRARYLCLEPAPRGGPGEVCCMLHGLKRLAVRDADLKLAFGETFHTFHTCLQQL